MKIWARKRNRAKTGPILSVKPPRRIATGIRTATPKSPEPRSVPTTAPRRAAVATSTTTRTNTAAAAATGTRISTAAAAVGTNIEAAAAGISTRAAAAVATSGPATTAETARPTTRVKSPRSEQRKRKCVNVFEKSFLNNSPNTQTNTHRQRKILTHTERKREIHTRN
uniref:(northern house mosquito) hypothetical protein n=1 Tax=Culex pipiens TaxID=7175 RepID=A0A8D8EYJ0_CULPI